MKNDILFTNIFLNSACLSSFSKIKENLKELSDTVSVGDDGEWNFKLNVAINSFDGVDVTNPEISSVRDVITGVQEFVELLENYSHQEEIDLHIIKDFNFVKMKFDKYCDYLKSSVQLRNADVVTLENIADFICGDDQNKYPIYRSSFYLTKFFKEIKINVEHDCKVPLSLHTLSKLL